MHVPISRSSVVCPICHLSQFEPGNGICRRCHHSLGVAYIELFLPSPHRSLDFPAAARMEIGRFIRRLRYRRGITQAVLGSLTGIHRTYLSRAEHGQVMPSTVALLRIAGALGADKILLRVRSSPRKLRGA